MNLLKDEDYGQTNFKMYSLFLIYGSLKWQIFAWHRGTNSPHSQYRLNLTSLSGDVHLSILKKICNCQEKAIVICKNILILKLKVWQYKMKPASCWLVWCSALSVVFLAWAWFSVCEQSLWSRVWLPHESERNLSENPDSSGEGLGALT